MAKLISGVYLLVVTCTVALCQEYKVVQTPVGNIRGLVDKVGEEKIYNFRGIPFAKPPVGDLRFRKPQPYGSWDYTLDATKDTSPCMQPVEFGGLKLVTNDRVSEDCLFLNIHVPKDVSITQNKAVMVWIHGGGFFMGQGSWYNASELAVKGDVIVVTVNYRLGIFGFLSTFDEASPGNYGLWDQIMALQWVKSNIAAFGGNPSLITIFGESAGGMSVSVQSIIPYNKGLFQRVIAQSGVSNTAKIAMDIKPVYDFLSENGYCLDVTPETTHALIQCLRRMPADQLQNVSQGVVMKQVAGMEFKIVLGPALDRDLLKADPEELFSDKSSEEMQFFKSLDYMAGTTDGEGSLILMMLPMLAEQFQMNVTEGVPTKVLCDVYAPKFANTYFKNVSGTADALCKKYTVDSSRDNYLGEQGAQLLNMYGDMSFVGPTVKTLKVHDERNSNGKTYHYLFSRAFEMTFGVKSPPWFQGAGHGIDLFYLFGAAEMAEKLNITMSEEDKKLENSMIKYWTNFAKYGDPNGESLPQWQEYGSSRNYLDLCHQISSGTDLYSDRMSFLHGDMLEIVAKGEKSGRDEL